jgi:protein-tyrosine-phosphatase
MSTICLMLCYYDGMSVLFICKSNVGRSQMAMAMYNQLYPGEAASAGTVVDVEGQRVGDRPRAVNAIAVMREVGIEISDYTRLQVTPNMLDNFDEVIVMSEPDATPEYLRESPKSKIWDIKDPAFLDLAHTLEVRNQISEKVTALGAELHQKA